MSASENHARRLPLWLIALAFIALACIVYIPVFNAKFIWDDPDYVVNNALLRSFDGLTQIWTSRHATPQFYPVTFTSFWIEFQLYDALGLGTPREGLFAPGYHATNVVLHGLAGFLLWRVLAKLGVPGAWLAALVWMLHPIQVESVAWITERKNTLSAVLYFAAGWAFLRASPRDATSEAKVWDIDRRWWWISLALFVLALLTKSVTASLPAAILVVLWWKTGRVARVQVLRLVPFFLAAMIAGANTAMLERELVGASGDEWNYAATTAGEFFHRSLIAGRALWFYAMKIVAPYPLAFIYERWNVSIHSWWQWLFPVSALLVVTVLAWLTWTKQIGRGPLACTLFFAGTIFPAIGYFNVFPHRYSFVADHFQYIAGAGLIVMICAGIARATGQIQLVVGIILCVVLSGLSFSQSRIYKDFLTLWTDTREKSPNSWMVHTNYGHAMIDLQRNDEAVEAYSKALALKRNPETLNNVAVAMMRAGRLTDARPLLLEAEQISPNYPLSTLSLANLLAELGDLEGATERIVRVLESSEERDPEASRRLAIVLMKKSERETDERIKLDYYVAAIQAYRNAVTFSPESLLFRKELGDVLIQAAVCQIGLGMDHRALADEARHNFEKALEVSPRDRADLWRGYGESMMFLSRFDEARQALERARELDANDVRIQTNLQTLTLLEERHRQSSTEQSR